MLYDIGKNIVGQDNEKCQTISHQIKVLSEKRGYPSGEVLHYQLEHLLLLNQNRLEEGMEVIRQGLAIAIKHNLKEPEAICYNAIGKTFYRLNKADSSVYYILKFTEAMEEMGNLEKAAVGYFNLGILASTMRDMKKSIEYSQKSLDINLEINPESNLASDYRGLATSYFYDRQYENATPLYLRGLEYAERFDDTYEKINIYINLGLNYLYLEESEKGRDYYHKAHDLLKSYNDPRAMGTCLNGLSRIYYHLEDFALAQYYARQSIQLADSVGLLEIQKFGYKYLAYASAGAEQLDSAFQQYQNFVELEDSIRDSQNRDFYADLQIKYDTQQKEKELMEKELELSKQANLQNQIIIGAILLILLLTALFQYLKNKTKLKQQKAEHALQLEQAEADKLRELDQIKSTFFANISHEFRTPLTLIKTPLQDLIKGKLKGRQEKYFRIMDRNADRLMNLINQLLDLSKLESGKMQLEVAEGDINKFVRAIAYSFESLAFRKQIEFQVNISQKTINGFFDRDKLEKILTNLLSNAFKFTPEEGRISIEAERMEDKFFIKVSDNGMGIPKSHLPNIFERFYHVGEASDVQASSGVGLALTKELVEMHKGKIEVESEENKGSAFMVILPISKNNFSENEISDTPLIRFEKTETIEKEKEFKTEKTIAVAPVLKNDQPTVLVVEDNPDVRTYIQDQLHEQFNLLEAEHGREGFELALENIPDLIISDVMMPEMDGTELCKQLKTNDKTSHIPVIMLTAKADRSDKLEGLETGADDYLTKPFDAEELQVRMKNLIEQRKRLREKFKGEGILKPKEIAVTSVDELFLNKVMETVEENMEDEEFSVEDLAGAVAMSRSQLHRKIKALTDVSPSVFIRTLRLERGKQLLEQNAGNASEVAFMVGFNSSTYFAKCFKERFGVSPGEVRVGF